jgi:hypothetical protein
VWTNPADNSVWVFVANASGISGLKLSESNCTPTLTTAWSSSIANSPASGDPGGASPIVVNNTLNGTNQPNSVLFYAGYNRTIRALDPMTGKSLWSATTNYIHWQSPIVANGVVYITDETRNSSEAVTGGYLTAFHLPPTAAYVSRFTVSQRGSTVIFSWRTATHNGIAGFDVFAGHHRLNPTMIRPHTARSYRYATHYRGPGQFALHVLLVNGHSVIIPRS